MTGVAQNIAIRGNKMKGREQILDVPRVSVYKAGGSAPASGVATIVTWDTEEYDNDGMWSTLAPTALIASTAGLYDVTAWGTWAPDATVTRRMWIAKTTPLGVVTTYFSPGAEINAVGAGLTTTQQVGHQIQLDADDQLTVTIQQFTAGGIAWNGSTATLRTNGFQACLIST